MEEYRKYEPIFGSWYLSRFLGKGSFGKVFEITREEFGTTYKSALKVITVPQDEDDIKSRMTEGTDIGTISEYYENILREIINENEIMAQLKGNSNIVSYEDHQIIPHEDGIGYDILIRMELLTPLLDRMVKGRLDEKEVVKLGMDICRALELCHRKNIIHRDIKPQNIFVSENGDFKLGDFGIARTMEKTTGGMSRKGTDKYMAPEVFKGEPYDETADIYSLGLVLYSLLNGNRSPFLPAPPARVTPNDEEMARMKRLRGEEIPIPRDAGPMLGMIIRKACAYRPEDRYSSAEQMRRDLESYYNNYSVLAEQTADDDFDEKTVFDPSVRARTGRYTGSYAAAGAVPRETGSIYGKAGIDQPRMPGENEPHRVQQPAVSGKDSGEGKKSKAPLVISVVVLAALISAGGLLIHNIMGGGKLDMSEAMAEPVFRGYDGYGRIEGGFSIDEGKREDLLLDIRNDEKRSAAKALLDSAAVEVSKTDNLSNGEEITVSVSYDAELADKAGLTVSDDEFSIKVSGLDEMPEELADATYYNGHFYKLYDDAGYWSDARAACESKGGHLATVTDADEQRFIEELIESDGNLYHYWLGATDEDDEGVWRWVTGEDWGYDNWCGNQPNNIETYEPVGQDYLEIQKTRGDQGSEEYMTWTDIGDSGEAGERFFGPPDYNETKYYGYICEWE